MWSTNFAPISRLSWFRLNLNCHLTSPCIARGWFTIMLPRSEQIPSASSGVYQQHQLQYKPQQSAPSSLSTEIAHYTARLSELHTLSNNKYPLTYSKYAVTNHIDIVTLSKPFAAMAWHCRSNTVALLYDKMAASCWRLVIFLARRSTRVTLKFRAHIATVDRN